MSSSIGSVTLLLVSTMNDIRGRDQEQRLDSDLFCRVSHLTSDLDLWCVYFVMELNTHRGKLKKRY